ncbi:ribose 1,5-bisphosphate isomerase [Thermococci archaeon]|nr:MAG: ribose 1,5-bisphosphate isomerase [Thermococci archaeon]
MDKNVLEIGEKIKNMEIRGAAKIGRETAGAVKFFCENFSGSKEDFIKELKENAKFLVDTRPTAVSLSNSLRYIFKNMDITMDMECLRTDLIKRSEEFIELSLSAIKKIGEIGANRIRDGDKIMTHCNSSCAISVIKTAFRKGKDFEVFVRETRPRYQGLLTAKELCREGIKTNLIVDSAARYFMADMNIVIIGADAVAANGAVVNKIGTSELALIAKEARVDVMIAAETYKFHPETIAGKLIEIEERDWREVISEEKRKEIGNIKIRNPSFDVTPPEFIDLIITEKGIISPQASIIVLNTEYGWYLNKKDFWEI